MKEVIYKNSKKNENQFNISIFKLTQKLNLLYQKEAINCMINILKKDEKNIINNYKDIIDEIEKTDTIKSIYLRSQDIKNMIINYINKIIKN